MRLIIYGAGAVGGVIGAELFRAGTDVVLIARGEHLDALRTGGLRYQTPREDLRLPIAAAGHPRDIDFRPDDVVFLTMKTQHTLQALEDLRAAGGDRLPIVCCQNGVANERLALRRFRTVHAMCVFLPAQFLQPGRIQTHTRTRSGVLDLGAFPHGADSLAIEIAGLLEQANFSSRPDPAVMRYKYAKLLMNLSNGIDAIVPAGADADRIIEILRQEGRACYRAAGIEWASVEEVRERIADRIETVEIEGVERVGGSTRQSLMRATGDIEIDWLNGEIALLGRMHGVPTPANTVIQRLANDLARRKGSSRSISADRVTGLIEVEAAGVRQ